MTLSDLASIGSLISGVSVLISLIYLSLQVKQAERNQQASIRAARASRIIDLFMGCAQPSLADAVLKGMRGAGDMSDAQIFQFTNYVSARFFNAEDAFYQYREGLLGAYNFESVTKGLQMSLANPGMRTVYRSVRGMMGSEFVKFADKLLADTPVVEDVDATARFMAEAAAEKAKAAS